MSASVISLPKSYHIWNALKETHQESRSVTRNWKAALKPEATTMFYERRTHGWDGYNALPISQKSLEYTHALIDLFSNKLRQPELVPESTGLIGLEWYLNENKIFSMTVHNDGIVIFAGILGKNKKIHGEDVFKAHELPEQVETILSRHFLT